MRIAAAACLAVAMAVLGFAHRPLPGFPRVLDMVEVAGIARGDVCTAPSDLARAADDRASARDHAGRHLCDACLLFAGPGLLPVASVLLDPGGERPTPVPTGEAAPSRPRIAGPSARGPPAVG